MSCLASTLLLIAALGVALVAANDYLAPSMVEIPQTFVSVGADSGVLANRPARGLKGVLFSHEVRVESAAWIRLQFDRSVTSLGGIINKDGAYLRIVSLKDNAEQYLNAQSLAQWSFTSAYFNGGAVRVELIAFLDGDESRVSIAGAWAGHAMNQTATSICNTQDQRQLSYDNRNARYLGGGGCSGWLIDDRNKCFLTAGHCGTDSVGSGVLEFNVPLSTATGAIVHPPPEDQFAVDAASVQRLNGGVGNDWQYMGAFPNSNTGLSAYEHVGRIAHRLATSVPVPNSQPLCITGYGVTEFDLSRTWNQVQKTHTGPFSSTRSGALYHRTDTTGGNSGSAIEDVERGVAIGIHTHGGCGRTGSGSNAGTDIVANAGLQRALSNPRGVCA